MDETNWQPIETAPKDVRILAWDKVQGRYATEWGNGKWLSIHASLVAVVPTHWMPLPEPPALSQAIGNKESGSDA